MGSLLNNYTAYYFALFTNNFALHCCAGISSQFKYKITCAWRSLIPYSSVICVLGCYCCVYVSPRLATLLFSKFWQVSMPNLKCFSCASAKKSTALKADDSVKCSRCGVHFHRSCGDRASPQPDGSFLKCCRLTVDDSTKTSSPTDDTDSTPSSLELHCNRIGARVSQLVSRLDGIDTKLQEITSLSNAVHNLEKRVIDIERSLSMSPVNVDSVVNEVQDRLSRANNLLIFKLPEVAAEDSTSDTQEVVTALSSIKDISLSNLSVTRLGKPNKSVTRPTLVRMNSNADV